MASSSSPGHGAPKFTRASARAASLLRASSEISTSSRRSSRAAVPAPASDEDAMWSLEPSATFTASQASIAPQVLLASPQRGLAGVAASADDAQSQHNAHRNTRMQSLRRPRMGAPVTSAALLAAVGPVAVTRTEPPGKAAAVSAAAAASVVPRSASRQQDVGHDELTQPVAQTRAQAREFAAKPAAAQAASAHASPSTSDALKVRRLRRASRQSVSSNDSDVTAPLPSVSASAPGAGRVTRVEGRGAARATGKRTRRTMRDDEDTEPEHESAVQVGGASEDDMPEEPRARAVHGRARGARRRAAPRASLGEPATSDEEWTVAENVKRAEDDEEVAEVSDVSDGELDEEFALGRRKGQARPTVPLISAASHKGRMATEQRLGVDSSVLGAATRTGRFPNLVLHGENGVATLDWVTLRWETHAEGSANAERAVRERLSLDMLLQRLLKDKWIVGQDGPCPRLEGGTVMGVIGIWTQRAPGEKTRNARKFFVVSLPEVRSDVGPMLVLLPDRLRKVPGGASSVPAHAFSISLASAMHVRRYTTYAGGSQVPLQLSTGTFELFTAWQMQLPGSAIAVRGNSRLARHWADALNLDAADRHTLLQLRSPKTGKKIVSASRFAGSDEESKVSDEDGSYTPTRRRAPRLRHTIGPFAGGASRILKRGRVLQDDSDVGSEHAAVMHQRLEMPRPPAMFHCAPFLGLWSPSVHRLMVFCPSDTTWRLASGSAAQEEHNGLDVPQLICALLADAWWLSSRTWDGAPLTSLCCCVGAVMDASVRPKTVSAYLLMFPGIDADVGCAFLLLQPSYGVDTARDAGSAQVGHPALRDMAATCQLKLNEQVQAYVADESVPYVALPGCALPSGAAAAFLPMSCILRPTDAVDGLSRANAVGALSIAWTALCSRNSNRAEDARGE